MDNGVEAISAEVADGVDQLAHQMAEGFEGPEKRTKRYSLPHSGNSCGGDSVATN